LTLSLKGDWFQTLNLKCHLSSTCTQIYHRTQNNVGVFDTTTNVFTTIATTGAAASGDVNYWEAAAVGDKVYSRAVDLIAHRRRSGVLVVARCRVARGGDGGEDARGGVQHPHVFLAAGPTLVNLFFNVGCF
jgi:hypothetical protein